MLENVINDIFEIVIIVSISIVAIYLLVPFINKKYEVKWRKWIWIMLAIRLLIPYNFSISTTPIRFLTDIGVTQEVSQVVNQTSGPNLIGENDPNVSKLTQQSQKEGLKTPIAEMESILKAIWNANIYVKLVFIWALGMIIAVYIHLMMYFVFRRNCISNCENIEDTNILICIEKAKRTCNICKQIPVYYCSTITSPMMMGIFKTILLIPKQKYEENELEVILKVDISTPFFILEQIAREIAAELGSSEFSISIPSNSSREIVFKRSAADIPLFGFRRKSNGPSFLNEKPLSGLSICIDETPKSASTKFNGPDSKAI